MNQEKYREAEAAANVADRKAQEVLGYMWDSILQIVDRCEAGQCQECGEDGDDSGSCPECGYEVEPCPLIALDPLSIEDDGRIILTFGGPNIWVSADDMMCGAWWGGTIRCYPPTTEHADALERIREDVTELAAC